MKVEGTSLSFSSFFKKAHRALKKGEEKQRPPSAGGRNRSHMPSFFHHTQGLSLWVGALFFSLCPFVCSSLGWWWWVRKEYPVYLPSAKLEGERMEERGGGERKRMRSPPPPAPSPADEEEASPSRLHSLTVQNKYAARPTWGFPQGFFICYDCKSSIIPK